MNYAEAFRSVGSPTRARVEEFLFSFFLVPLWERHLLHSVDLEPENRAQ